MSRKILGPIATEASKIPAESANATPVERANPLRSRPIMNSPDLIAGRETQPVGALGASLSRLNERGKHAENIEKKLAAGQSIVQLDTALIDPSFVSDRMPVTEEALADLVEAIRNNGQLSPVLVRPSIENPGRYQTAFGHRRIRAVAILGISVRAIVRELSDEEMVVAQGQENHARKDLSYIEKARFAQRLEDRFSRDTIMAALSIYKSDLSNMLSVAHRIPEDVVDAIGPAPKIGRRGWIELADLLKNPNMVDIARKAAVVPDFLARSSDGRFKAVLAAVKPTPAKAQVVTLTSGQGEKLGRIVSDARRVIVTVDRRQSPVFAEFLLAKVKDLCAELEQSGARKANP